MSILLWADITKIGGKVILISIQNLNSFTDKTTIVPRKDYTKIFYLWNPLALYSQTCVQRNSLKINPNYKSSWGKVKWNEVSLVLFQRFIQQILIGHLLCDQHGARCLDLQWWTKQKYPLPSQSCFWQGQGKSDSITWQKRPMQPCRMQTSQRAQWRSPGDLRQKQRKGRSERFQQFWDKLLPKYSTLCLKHETMQKYSNVKPLFKIKEEIIG